MVTVLTWVLYVIATFIRQFFDVAHTFSFTWQAVCYLVVVTFPDVLGADILAATTIGST